MGLLDAYDRCVVCKRSLPGHVIDIERGMIKAHKFQTKANKKKGKK